MNGLQSLLTHPAVVRFGWTLIHFLWQGAAVAALLALTLLLLRRATAGARYLAACGALLLMTAAPVLTYWHLAPPTGSPQRASAGLPELPDIAPSGNVGVSAPAADPSAARVSPRPLPLLPPAAPRPWHARAMHWIEANLRWFVGAWFCGVLCLSIRLLFGWRGVRRIRRSGVGASETLQNRLKGIAGRLSVARPVRLLTSAIADAPVVIGWFRPVVLFPASVLTQLPPLQLEAILAHELAHVRRHDYLVNLFQTVVETFLFYHPAVHWVSHRVRVEREHCCDDLAVSACGDSALYARALARLAEMSIAAPRLVPAAGGQLLGRIRRLLSADARCDRRASVWVGGTVLAAALLACVIALGASTTAPQEKPGLDAAKSAEGINNLPATRETKTGELNAILRPGPGQPASQELISKMLKENSLWLRPPLRNLVYTFSMTHVGKDDTWKAEVAYAAPNDLTIAYPKEKIYSGKADDTYDPRIAPCPIGLRTVVQGVTFVSPLVEFQAAPQRYDVSMIGEDAASGRDAFVLHIKPIGRPSEKAMQRWDADLKMEARGSKYEYEFFPDEQEIRGVMRTVIGLKCLLEEGPSWKAILAARNANPAEIRWNGWIITLKTSELQGETRTGIDSDWDREFTGKRPAIFTSSRSSGENGMTRILVLGEGERMVDEAYYRELKAKRPGPKLTLPMRVGCGIWDRWYGYGHGHADTDQVWIDKETGGVLREEGFCEGRCEFVIEYGDWEALPGGGRAPTHVTVSLPPSYTDIRGGGKFDMSFMTLGGKAWLLDHLTESFGAGGVSVTASVSDVNAVPENPMEAPAAEKAKETPAGPQTSGTAGVPGNVKVDTPTKRP